MSARESSIAARNADLKGSMDPNRGVPYSAEFRALKEDAVNENDSSRGYGDLRDINRFVPRDIPDGRRD